MPTNAGLGSKSDAEQIQCALLNHGWLCEHIEDREAFVGGLNSVFDDGCPIADEGLKTVDLGPLGGLFGKGLELCGGGSLGGSDHGSTGGLGLRLLRSLGKKGSPAACPNR